MKWILATSYKTSSIVPAQRHLFKKYLSAAEIRYVSNFNYPVEQWCENMAFQIEDEKDDYVVFGLDDYLPIDYPKSHSIFFLFNQVAAAKPVVYHLFFQDFERVGLGWGDARTKQTDVFENKQFLKYSENAKYQVTCQFSIWKTKSLVRVLREVSSTPWDFELQGKCKAFAFRNPAFRWIEEGALSDRKKGKVNVQGLRPSDIQELIDLDLINEQDIIYGWQGGDTPDLGPKYSEYYDI